MKSFSCDICGSPVGEYELRTLYENIQQDAIKDVCKKCYNELLDATTKIEATLKEVRISWIRKVFNKMVSKNEKV